MKLESLYAALDRKPFTPFSIELISGTPLIVMHPENVILIPHRAKVHHIEVFAPNGEEYVMIAPEGLLALHWNADGHARSSS